MYNLSPDDFLLLQDPKTQALIENHLGEDPVSLAFRLKCGREQARLVCQQVKMLSRAKSKLPAFYQARCILPPVSYQQCSSEASASTKDYSGQLCIDLTCGLGVDSFHFSKSFAQVIALERDPLLADVARHNFDLLQAGNITVENTSAEEFLSAYTGPKAELIYLDPARRSGGERVFLPEDCSPNVLEIRSDLLKHAEKVLIKLSPLFDIEEAPRLFSPHVSRLEIVSVCGEVKDFLVELTEQPEKTEIVVTLHPERRFMFHHGDLSTSMTADSDSLSHFPYLLIPDAAFYKGRLAHALLRYYCPEADIIMPTPQGFAFSGTLPQNFPGRVYRILHREDYQPKRLKKSLKKEGIKRINILRRNFPQSSMEITQALAVQEGGADWFAFTAISGRPVVLRVEPVNKPETGQADVRRIRR